MSGQWIEGRGYRKQILADAQELSCPGTLVQIVEIVPNSAVSPHYHKTSVEVFHILEGTGRMTIGGVEHLLSPGDTLMCKPMEIHDSRNEGAATWRYIVFKTNVTEDDLFWTDA